MMNLKTDESLFEKAGQLAKKKGLHISSQIVLQRICAMRPICQHCGWRSFAALMKDYEPAKISKERAIERAIEIEKQGFHRANLVSGWPGYDVPEHFYEITKGIRENTSLELFCMFGAINENSIVKLKKAGLDGVWCGIETTNKAAFKRIRPGDNFDARLDTLRIAKKLGLKTATTFIVGIGETEQDDLDCIDLSRQLEVDTVIINSFTPSPFTGMEQWSIPDPYKVAEIVAKTRIAMKNANIGACFGGDSLANFAWGIKSGANAFAFIARSPKEDPALLGDEFQRFKTIWKEHYNTSVAK